MLTTLLLFVVGITIFVLRFVVRIFFVHTIKIPLNYVYLHHHSLSLNCARFFVVFGFKVFFYPAKLQNLAEERKIVFGTIIKNTEKMFK